MSLENEGIQDNYDHSIDQTQKKLDSKPNNDWVYDYGGKIVGIIAIFGGPCIAVGISFLFGVEKNFFAVMLLLIFGFVVSFSVAWRLNKFFDRYR